MTAVKTLEAPAPDPDSPEHRIRRLRRIAAWILLGGFGSFMVWAALAPLDQGVPAHGLVVVDGQRKTVQHPQGGIVQAIHVRDGDVVQAGDPVIELYDVTARANRSIARAQWISSRAREARLQAELAGADAVQFPASLMNEAEDEQVAAAMALERALLASRRQVFRAEIEALEETRRGLNTQIRALEEGIALRQMERGAAREQLEALADLAASGVVPRTRLLTLEREVAQLDTQLASMRGDLGRLMSQRAELALTLARRRDEALREIQAELLEVKREAESAESRLAATTFELENAVIRAPAAGEVVGLTVFTEGGVVGAGERLMDIVPIDQPLEVEAQVPVHLIDSVKLGLPVTLMFTALNLNITPVAEGEVVHVSADRLVDPVTGQPYFKIRARATEEGIAQLRGQRLRPGMPVDVFIKTGERSFLAYLIKPLRDQAAMALTEK